MSFKSTDKLDYADNQSVPPSANIPGGKPGGKASLLNRITNKDKTNRSKSPFKLLSNRLSREPSPVASTTKPVRGKNANKPPAAKISRSSEFGIKQIGCGGGGGGGGAMKPIMETSHRNKSSSAAAMASGDDFAFDTDSSFPVLESDDVELQAIIDYIDEFYYGVRLFPGQDGSKVTRALSFYFMIKDYLRPVFFKPSQKSTKNLKLD